MNQSKSLIIAGVPRIGKTTICEAIAKRENFQHIEADSLTFAFQNTYPEIGITHTDFWDLIKTSKPFSKFLASWIKEIGELSNCRKIHYKIVIDLYHIVPEDFAKYFSREYCDIYFLGYPNISIEEKVKQIRQFDTIDDWTRKETDEELRKRIQVYIEISKYLQEECKKYDLPFIDVSQNRTQVLEDLLDKIKKENS